VLLVLPRRARTKRNNDCDGTHRLGCVKQLRRASMRADAAS
jgi:hypothetical protein